MRITLLFLLFINTSFAQLSIADLNKKLGKGVNMGNMFEAPTETEWGNPFQDGYFTKVAGLGFNHVRIPIRWDTPVRSGQTSPFTVNFTFINRIKNVVDQALKENLYVIINMHHHETLFTDPDANTDKFLAQWTQISEAFKTYDQRVLFEVLNEPHDKLNAAKWNPLFKKALEIIRKNNPNRGVLIAPPNYNGLSGVSSLEIPNDPNLIISIHYYDPFNFTHQGADWIGAGSTAWLGTKWENTTQERNEVIQSFDYLKNLSKAKNIPVHIGEFGAYSKADMESRAKWTNFLARWFEEQGFSWAYWEFSAGFGIYDPKTGNAIQPLATALVKDGMYLATEILTQTVYSATFQTATDPWFLGLNGTAKGTVALGSNQANVSVTQSSDQSWHAQLLRNNIKLVKGKRYFVSFEISSSETVSGTQYIGKNGGDYASYSGYKGYSVDKNGKVSYSFIMTSATDEAARVVFDIGTAKSNFTVKNFRIEEEKIVVLATETPSIKVKVYPNPSSEYLKIESDLKINEYKIYDLSGKMLDQNILKTDTIDLKSIPSGKYIILINTEKGTTRQRFIKK